MKLEMQRGDEERRSEQAQGWLDVLLDVAPIVFFSLDAQGKLIFAEGRALAALHRHPNEYIGGDLTALFGQEPWVLSARRCALVGESFVAAGPIGEAWFELHCEPIPASTHGVAGVAGVALDVTVQERVAAELRQQQALLRYVINHVPHAIFWKDRKSCYLGGNQNFLRDASLEAPEQLIGKTDYDFFTKEQADFCVGMDQEVMASGLPKLEVEEPLTRPDGQQRTILTSKVPLRGEDGAVTGLLGIYADITERKRSEIELFKAKEAAEAAAQAKGEFLTVMSHELRTPLTLILGPLESLLSRKEVAASPTLTLDLKRIQRNAARLHRLVNDILEVQKAEAGKLEIHWEQVDAVALLAELVDDAQAEAKRRELQLVFSAEPGLPALPLDRSKFEKIAQNLVGNALKFTPCGGQVQVSLRRAGAEVELCVADTGPGIAEDQQHLLFRRFQQIDASTTRTHEGTGIGLVLVKELTEAMGGSVAVESRSGCGARFFVRLASNQERPVSVPQAPGRSRVVGFDGFVSSTPVVAPLRSDPKKDRPRVLIVEDNPDMRAYLAEILGDEYQVEVVRNGREALAVVAGSRRPQVVVSDVMMPELDGHELTRRLKAEPSSRDIPIILLTAKASREELIGGLELGADDYLGKPFSPPELKARVQAALRLHRVYLELAEKNQELQHTLVELTETREQLIHAAKMAAVGTLVAGLAHELNNPLASILLSTQFMLRRSPADDPARRSLVTIERNTARCASLVQSLLKYSRKTPPSRVVCAIDAVVARILELCQPQAERCGIALEVGLAPGLPAIAVHVSGLESALVNLISNALDASSSGGGVLLTINTCARDGVAGLEIAVEDHGTGIVPDVLPRLFEPFFTTKPPGQGTGLGLALTRAFAVAHGGTIDVDSKLGRGTRVSLWLPQVGPEPDAGGEG